MRFVILGRDPRVRNGRIGTRFRVIAATVLVLLSLAPGPAALGPPPANAFPASTWTNWASVAWRYFQNCWNPTTGLAFDACGWHYFTDWGLASYVLAIISAHELALVTDTETYSFGYRVGKVLNFLNTRQLTVLAGHQVPCGVYESDTGNPKQRGWDTNGADYARLLGALYLLKSHLTELGGQQNLERAGLVDSAVGRVDNSCYGFGSS